MGLGIIRSSRIRPGSFRFISSSTLNRNKTELQKQKEEFIQSQYVPRNVKVKKKMSKRINFKGDAENQSFIRDELFGRYEVAKFWWFEFKNPVKSRLDWFNDYPHFRKGMSHQFLKEQNLKIEEEFENEKIYKNLKKYSKYGNYDDPSSIMRNQIEVIEKLTELSPNDALIIANHFACEDVLANYYDSYDESLDESDVLVPCLHEVLAESNGQQFNSKIESFDDNIVINGLKSFIPG